jgi:hypothetical protein
VQFGYAEVKAQQLLTVHGRCPLSSFVGGLYAQAMSETFPARYRRPNLRYAISLVCSDGALSPTRKSRLGAGEPCEASREQECESDEQPSERGLDRRFEVLCEASGEMLDVARSGVDSKPRPAIPGSSPIGANLAILQCHLRASGGPEPVENEGGGKTGSPLSRG